VFSWPGPDVRITWQSERTGIENNWFALIGRVVAVQVEADGDLHIALGNATGDKPGIVVCELPAEPRWCEFATSFSVGQERNSPCTFDRREVTVAEGVGVIIDSKGHLGTVVSSQRFKDEIKPMDKASEAILALQPMTFRYKHSLDPKGIPQFGLVAEQVAKVNPDLVARDEQGKPYTVRYEAVNAMLLNEFLKEHRKVEKLEAAVAQQHQDFEAAIAQLKAQVQKVSAQVEARRGAQQTLVGNP